MSKIFSRLAPPHFAAALTLLACACGSEDPGDRLGLEPGIGVDAAAATEDNPYGVTAHMAPDAMVESFAQIGIGWMRFDMDWNLIEPQQGQFNWYDADRVMDAADRLGLHVFVAPAYTPEWASGNPDESVPPQNPEHYLAFLRTVVARYRGRIDCIGVWNEPNLSMFFRGSKSQFINDFFVPGLRTIKEAAPEQRTCGPDLSSSGNERDDWLDPMLRAGGQYLDVITHHQYDGDDTPWGRAEEIEKFHNKMSQLGHGDKPLWIAEIGWMRPGVSDQQQSDYLRQTMDEMSQRPYWHKTFWYDSHGGGWGLLGADGNSDVGQPTPSYFAYRDAIAGVAPPPQQRDRGCSEPLDMLSTAGVGLVIVGAPLTRRKRRRS